MEGLLREVNPAFDWVGVSWVCALTTRAAIMNVRKNKTFFIKN